MRIQALALAALLTTSLAATASLDAQARHYRWDGHDNGLHRGWYQNRVGWNNWNWQNRYRDDWGWRNQWRNNNWQNQYGNNQYNRLYGSRFWSRWY